MAKPSDSEVTPEMVQAGSAALEHRLWLMDPDSKPMAKTYRSIVVREVFEAMLAVSASADAGLKVGATIKDARTGKDWIVQAVADGPKVTLYGKYQIGVETLIAQHQVYDPRK